MSSSAPKRQPVPEGLPFAYADADLSSTVGGGEYDAAQAAEQRSLRQQADAFEQGRQNAQLQLRSELDMGLAKNREQIGRALLEFTRERQNYYLRVEREIVQLALAIARKILHREVQTDPHALAGIVRVTLDKLDGATQVNLYVNPKEATDWRHYFACQNLDAPPPDVHEDAAVPPGECRVETSLGSTQVGIESQLKEIETGLLDLLAERPGVALVAAAAASTASRTPEPR
jgi:flagellar assembly protein FliH